MSGALNLNVVTNYLPTLEEDDVEIMNSYILIIQNLLIQIMMQLIFQVQK